MFSGPKHPVGGLLRIASVMDEAELDFEDCLHDEDGWQESLSDGPFDEPPAAEAAAVGAGEVNGDGRSSPRCEPVAQLSLQQEPAPGGRLSLSPLFFAGRCLRPLSVYQNDDTVATSIMFSNYACTHICNGCLLRCAYNAFSGASQQTVSDIFLALCMDCGLYSW